MFLMSEVPLNQSLFTVCGRRGTDARPRLNSVTDYSQVDMLRSRYQFVDFGVKKSPGIVIWSASNILGGQM